MPLSDDQLAYVRSEVGSKTPPFDADLNVAFDRLLDENAVALEVVRGRLADLLASAASFSADNVSIGTSANIAALERQAARLEKLVGGTVCFEQLTRCDTR